MKEKHIIQNFYSVILFLYGIFSYEKIIINRVFVCMINKNYILIISKLILLSSHIDKYAYAYSSLQVAQSQPQLFPCCLNIVMNKYLLVLLTIITSRLMTNVYKYYYRKLRQ